MGECLKARARRGAVGATARWAANLYYRWARLLPEEHPDLDSVFATLITTRYGLEALARPGGRTDRIRTALDILRDAGKIRSVCHIVVLILVAEAGFADNHSQTQEVFVAVVGSELTLAGVPGQYAFGEDLCLCPEGRCFAYRSTIQILRLLL